MTVDELIAKQEIIELVGRYMRGLDRLDKNLLRSTFHDDAQTDYGFFQGGPDAFVDMAFSALSEHQDNHHMIGQVNIDLQGDVAFGEVYFQAFHQFVRDGEQRDLFISGRYIDRYECRNDEWKIAFRSEVNDWTRDDPSSDGYFKSSPQGLRGARYPDDPVYDPNWAR